MMSKSSTRKTNSLISFSLLVLVILSVLSGCVDSYGLQGTPSGVSNSSIAGSTMTPRTILPSATSSATQAFIPSRTPLLLPSVSLTPTSSATTTVIPTLSAESARLRLIDFLSNNNGCRLPCLWGITPGKSTYHIATIILSSLSSISDFTVFGSKNGAIAPYLVEDEIKILIDVSILRSGDMVSQVDFHGRAVQDTNIDGVRGIVSIFDSKMFGERLNFFMLPNILSVYGPPTSVLLSTLAEFPDKRYGQGHFKILLLYPDQGIVVHYTTEMSVVGNNIVGCLANAHVDLDLYPSGHGDTFFDQIKPSGWTAKLEYYKPVVEVTSMTLEEFFHTFRQSTDVCIETPANLWPVPER